MSKGKQNRLLSDGEYASLAEFRYQLRKFLRHMEDQAREAGQNPQQYQLLLAVKGMPRGRIPTISAVAERMQLNHNSTVELIDRCQERGLLRRTRSGGDRREVMLAITPEGERALRLQARAARQELRTIGPLLVQALQELLHGIALGAASGTKAARNAASMTRGPRKRGP